LNKRAQEKPRFSNYAAQDFLNEAQTLPKRSLRSFAAPLTNGGSGRKAAQQHLSSGRFFPFRSRTRLPTSTTLGRAMRSFEQECHGVQRRDGGELAPSPGSALS
jgi:hypothetical protein